MNPEQAVQVLARICEPPESRKPLTRADYAVAEQALLVLAQLAKTIQEKKEVDIPA